MPRKKNRRKEIQAKRRAAEKAAKGRTKPVRKVAIIGHHASGSNGLLLAAMAAGLLDNKSN